MNYKTSFYLILLCIWTILPQFIYGVEVEPQKKLYSNLYAVVIGIDVYHDNKIPQLQYAENDANSIGDALVKIGFNKDKIFRLIGDNGTKKNILNIFTHTLSSTLKSDDGILVFFAGHGINAQVKNVRGELIEQGFILPVDASKDNISKTSISLTLLTDILSDLTAKHVLLTIDACYSGFALRRSASVQGYVEKLSQKRSRFVITAGGRDEQVVEVAGHGIFTEKFLDALEGVADFDVDGYITASELGTYLKSAVSKAANNEQTPIFGSLEGEGEFVINVAFNQQDYKNKIKETLVQYQIYDTFYSSGLDLMRKGRLKLAKEKFLISLKYRPNDYWALQKLKYIDTYKPYKQKILMDDGSSLILIKGDSFMMGENNIGFENEKPLRREYVPDFYISAYEVTLQQYSIYMKDSKSNNKPLNFDLQLKNESSDSPVHGTSWEDSCSYCEYYSGRLPSEKEWEFAARGSDGRRFVFGPEFIDNDSVNWSKDQLFRGVAPIGKYKTDQSIFGVFDLTGNIREWVLDVDSGYLLQELPLDKDGNRFKVVRGGSYKTRSPNLLRITVRSFRHPKQQASGIGFRCAKQPTTNDYE